MEIPAESLTHGSADVAFTPSNIGAIQNLSSIKLSPDGSKVVYRLSTAYKEGDYTTASIWYSPDSAKADSAKQVTSGLYDDGDPVWHPKENTIYFLSDRHKQGGPKQIYKYSLDGPGEPSLIDDSFKGKKRAVNQFKLSPDGHYIAFHSPDEPTDEEEKKDEEKDDARIWGERKQYARLRLYTLSTGEVRTLVEDQKHVSSCTWSPDSKSLLYLLHSRSDNEAIAEPTPLFLVSVLPSPPSATPKYITTFGHSPYGSILWPSPSHSDLFVVQPYEPQNFSDAYAVFRHSLSSSSPHHSEHQRFYLGYSEDAGSLIDLRSETGEFAVEVVVNTKTRVDILNREGRLFTLFETNGREGVGLLDVKKVENEFVLACARSSGPDKEGPNVWVGRVTEQKTLKLGTKLSSHFSWMNNSKLGDVEVFHWKGEDGVSLDGIAWYPQGVDPSKLKKPLPTVLHVHGGPYYRDTPGLFMDFGFIRWESVLAEQGYLVLCPNYRGSSGRGHEFARAAYHGTGTIEWSDVNSMVDNAIKRGLADPDKLAIGGWSQGGFITAWGVSQTKNKFRCGIMGAGVSDWGSMASESDMPDFVADCGGAAPWYGSAARLTGDAIRHAKGIETAVLILHGERDERVPIGQAVGFHRGLRRMSKHPERQTLVVYPREGHEFTERKHVEDVIKRVIAHYEAWLK